MTTEATTDAAETTDATTDTQAETDTATEPDWKAEAEKWKANSRKNEDKAKANSAAAKELEQFKAASMSENEKAIEAARVEARQATIGELGGRLVAAEIKSAAAGRIAPEALSVLVAQLNLSSFLDEEGEVDATKVTEFIDGIAPEAQTEQTETDRVLQKFDIGQGARGDQQALNGDPLQRALEAKLGIR